MLRQHTHLIRCMVMATLLVMNSAPLTFTQEKLPDPSNIIVLKVTHPNGTWAKIAVIEGEMLTIEEEKTGVVFGFYPVVRNAKTRTVEVRILQKQGPDGAYSDAERLEVSPNAPKITAASFKIELETLRKNSETNSSAATRGGCSAVKEAAHSMTSYEHAASPLALENCCVNCGGLRICANCSVSTECGCCCTGRDACCQICQ
jgi:tellurite resistance-related uncharacterized protein